MATHVAVIPEMKLVAFLRGTGSFSIPFEEVVQLVQFLQEEVVEAYGLNQPGAWMDEVPASRVLGREGDDG